MWTLGGKLPQCFKADRPLVHTAMIRASGRATRRQHWHHPLASVRGADNAVIFATTCGSQHVIAGRGAGRWATAESVVGDLLQIQRNSNVANRTPILASLTQKT